MRLEFSLSRGKDGRRLVHLHDIPATWRTIRLKSVKRRRDFVPAILDVETQVSARRWQGA